MEEDEDEEEPEKRSRRSLNRRSMRARRGIRTYEKEAGAEEDAEEGVGEGV